MYDGFSPDSRVNIVGNGTMMVVGIADFEWPCGWGFPTGPENLWNKSPWSGYIKNGRI
ncbi:MAG: hypothetical protein CM1200mP10_03180 [Candidatus Neomarinimicrobiota bacterium]|nr:MAG: hypothetical protein CM1200mP10_03180 [Candidatus Neomarinimicrobiota bacterium]